MNATSLLTSATILALTAGSFSCKTSQSKALSESLATPSAPSGFPAAPAGAKEVYATNNQFRVAYAFEDRTKQDGKIWGIDLDSPNPAWLQGDVKWKSPTRSRYFVEFVSPGGGADMNLLSVMPRANKTVVYALSRNSTIVAPEAVQAAFDKPSISSREFEKVAELNKIVIAPAPAAPHERTFYCADTRGGGNGYLIEQLTLLTENGSQKVKEVDLGRGDLTENGDGTVNHGYIYRGDTLITSDLSLRAESTEWKDALSFRLPVMEEVATSKTVLYIQPKNFEAGPQGEFLVRLKIIAPTAVDVKMRCNEI